MNLSRKGNKVSLTPLFMKHEEIDLQLSKNFTSSVPGTVNLEATAKTK